jgi:RNA polymerase sigma factor (sigma-70 family)
LRQLVSADACRNLTDGELLQRFAAARDEAAFGELLRRHGLMVLRACRRVLPNDADAEDVFQAAFLVLARKAGSGRWGTSVANWLYGVASRLALKARQAAARRDARTRQPPERRASDPLAEITLREAQAVLDEELGRLPERYRGPLVLCYLEGATRDEAARQLGWSLGTLKRRLEQGRGVLRGRLARRGLTWPAALAAVTLGESVEAGVLPRPLAASTTRAAALFADGAQAGTAGLPLRAAALAQRMGKGGRLAWLKTAAALSLALGVALVGAGAPGQRATPRGDTAGPPAEAARVDSHGDPLPPGALLRLGSLRLRTGAPVFAVLPTPDGKAVFSGAVAPHVRLWEVATGKEIRCFEVPQKPDADYLNIVSALALSSDGRTLAIGTRNGPFLLFEVATGKLLRTLSGQPDRSRAVAFSPDSKLLASTAGRSEGPCEIVLWDAGAGKELRRLPGHSQMVYRLTFSPDGKLLASAGEGGEVRLWDTATGRPLRSWDAHGKQPVMALAFTPDGKTLASAGHDGALRLWEVATGKPRKRQPDSAAFPTLAFSPDGKLLAAKSGAPGFVALWDVASGNQVELLKVKQEVRALAFLTRQDGLRLAAGTADGTVLLWDLPGSATLLRPDRVGRTAEALHALGHQSGVSTVAVSPDGKTIATGSHDHTVRLWDAASGKESRKLEGHWYGIKSLCYSPDGKLLVSAGIDGQVFVREATTGKILHHLSGCCAALSPDGKLLATATTDQKPVIQLWNVATWQELRRLYGPRASIFRLAFSPDGKTLASGGWGSYHGLKGGNVEFENRTMRLWDVASGRQLSQFGDPREYVYALVFTPDGKTLISGGDPSRDKERVPIRLWETATGKERGRIPGHRGGVWSLTLSPDGRTFASGSEDGTARLWDLHTRKELRRLQGHRGWVTAVTFGPGGRTLVTGSLDTTALVWDLRGLGAGVRR